MGNWACSMALVPKADMWIVAMCGASEGWAGWRVRVGG